MAGPKELAHTCTDPVCRHGEAPSDLNEPPRKRSISQYPIIGGLLRFFTWWLAFAGIYASSSVCVFCGTPGCPVGAGAAAMVGGVFGAIMAYGKMILTRLRGLVATLCQSYQD